MRISARRLLDTRVTAVAAVDGSLPMPGGLMTLVVVRRTQAARAMCLVTAIDRTATNVMRLLARF